MDGPRTRVLAEILVQTDHDKRGRIHLSAQDHPLRIWHEQRSLRPGGMHVVRYVLRTRVFFSCLFIVSCHAFLNAFLRVLVRQSQCHRAFVRSRRGKGLGPGVRQI